MIYKHNEIILYDIANSKKLTLEEMEDWRPIQASEGIINHSFVLECWNIKTKEIRLFQALHNLTKKELDFLKP